MNYQYAYTPFIEITNYIYTNSKEENKTNKIYKKICISKQKM